MIVFYLNNRNQQQARVIRHLYRSCTEEKQLQSTVRFDPEEGVVRQATLIVFAGFLRGEGLLYKYCVENKKNFLYVDHAYLNRGYNAHDPEKEWMRITPNAFTWNLNQTEPSDRWDKYFAQRFDLKPWNQNKGKYILALPPSESTKFLFPESVRWMEKALVDVSARTGLPIRVREKPLQVRVDPKTNSVIESLKFTHENTIDEEMLDARCIVTFNSAVPVTGTILGIPCYCSPYAAAYPMNVNLDYINNPPEPDRQGWLNQLVYHQYTTKEIMTGKAWQLLRKYRSVK